MGGHLGPKRGFKVVGFGIIFCDFLDKIRRSFLKLIYNSLLKRAAGVNRLVGVGARIFSARRGEDSFLFLFLYNLNLPISNLKKIK